MHARRSSIYKTAEEKRAAAAFFRGMFAGDTKTIERAFPDYFRMMERAQNEGTNPGGGYLVPELIENAIISYAEQHGLFRSFARFVGMQSDRVRIPRRTTDVQFTFTQEAATAAEQAATYGTATLEARKVLGFVKLTNELMEDAASAAEDLTIAFGEGLALIEDTVGFTGDASEDHGNMQGAAIMLADGAHAGGLEAAAGHDTFLELDATDLSNLVAKLPTRATANAAWYVSAHGAAKSFYRLAAGAGGIGRSAAGEPTFWNFPIRTTPTLPAVDTTLAGDAMLLLGDLRKSSVFGARRGLTLGQAGLGATFEYDMVSFRARARFHILHADLGDATTPGALVALIGKS